MAKKLFDFESEFMLGIDAMDNEHMQLVDMINQVHALISEGKRDEAREYFNEILSDYVVKHFDDEEKFMEEIGFPGLEMHKKIHENFKQSFYDLQPKIASFDDKAFRAALSDAFSWIITHIGKTDRRYAKYYFESQG